MLSQTPSDSIIISCVNAASLQRSFLNTGFPNCHRIFIEFVKVSHGALVMCNHNKKTHGSGISMMSQNAKHGSKWLECQCFP
jgi:hypothetical protein